MASTLIALRPLAADLVSAASSPTFGIRNGHRFVAFATAVDREVFWTDLMPSHYSSNGFTVTIRWMAQSATSGSCVLGVALERHNTGGQDLDVDSFATEKTITSSAQAVNGQLQEAQITFTNSEIDGIAAREQFRLRLRRIGTNGSDTMLGDCQVTSIELEQSGLGFILSDSFFTSGNGTDSAKGRGATLPVADGDNSLAHGSGVNLAVAANQSVGIGSSIDIDGPNAVAFGENHTATNVTGRVALFGSGHTAGRDGLVAGRSNTIGNFSGAIGDDIQVSAYSFGTGYNLDLDAGNFNVGIGGNLTSGGTYNVLLGYDITSVSPRTVGIGSQIDFDTSNDNQYSLAVGRSLTISGRYAVAFGRTHTIGIAADRSLTAGLTITNENGPNVLIQGSTMSLTNESSGHVMAQGQDVTTVGVSYSLIQGRNHTIGNGVTNIGHNRLLVQGTNHTIGTTNPNLANSIIQGRDHTFTDGIRNIIQGQQNTVNGDANIAHGYLAKITGDSDFASGFTNYLYGNYSFIQGNSNEIGTSGFSGHNNIFVQGSDHDVGKTVASLSSWLVQGSSNVVTSGTRGLIQGQEGLVAGSQVLIQGYDNHVTGSNNTSQGNVNRIYGSECLVQGLTNEVGVSGFQGHSNIFAQGELHDIGKTVANLSNWSVQGRSNVVTSGERGLIQGQDNTAAGSDMLVQGYSHDLAGSSLVCSGNNNSLFGFRSSILGNDIDLGITGTYDVYDSFAAGSNITIGANQTTYFNLAVGYAIDIDSAGGVLAVGGSLTSTGDYSFLHGYYSYADADRTFVQGNYARARWVDQKVWGSNRDTGAGDAQSSHVVPYIETTDATQTTIFTFDLEEDKAYIFSARVIARRDDANGDNASFILSQATGYRDVGGAAVLAGTPKAFTKEIAAGAAAWSVDIASSGNNILVRVTGTAAQTIQWCARIDIVEVKGS